MFVELCKSTWFDNSESRRGHGLPGINHGYKSGPT